MRPANRLYSGICIGAISAKQPSRRPFRLYLAIPLCRRCSDAPDCPLYHPRSDVPVTLPLRPCLDAIPLFRCAAPFRSNPLHCGIAPLEGGSVRTQARRPTISFLFAYPPLPRRIARRPPPYLLSPCLGTAPFPRCATPFGCTHCLAMPLLLTGSTRCPAIQKSPCCGVPVRIIPAVLPCRMTQRQLHCPRLGTTSFSPLYGPLRMRPTAPLCRRCAEIRLLPDHTPCSKAIPLPAVHPWPENSPPPPRRAATQWRHGGAAAPLCPTYFPSQTTRTGRFSFSVRPVFLWKLRRTTLSFFRMDNDNQAAG